MTTPQDIEQSRAECRTAFEFELIDNHMYVPSDMTRTGEFYADDELQFAWDCAWAVWEAARSVPKSSISNAENPAPVELPEPDAVQLAGPPDAKQVIALYTADTVRRLLERKP